MFAGTGRRDGYRCCAEVWARQHRTLCRLVCLDRISTGLPWVRPIVCCKGGALPRTRSQTSSD